MEQAFWGGESGEEYAPPDNRRGARQLALQSLYWEASLAGEARAALEELGERFQLSESTRCFARELVHCVGAHAAELDELIDAAASHWRRERLARLDHLILRLALAEMLYFADIPPRVSLEEAIELGKLYSTGQSHAFINGVLDAVARRKGLVA
jgi:transcription antitermination factor NusB